MMYSTVMNPCPGPGAAGFNCFYNNSGNNHGGGGHPTCSHARHGSEMPTMSINVGFGSNMAYNRQPQQQQPHNVLMPTQADFVQVKVQCDQKHHHPDHGHGPIGRPHCCCHHGVQQQHHPQHMPMTQSAPTPYPPQLALPQPPPPQPMNHFQPQLPAIQLPRMHYGHGTPVSSSSGPGPCINNNNINNQQMGYGGFRETTTAHNQCHQVFHGGNNNFGPAGNNNNNNVWTTEEGNWFQQASSAVPPLFTSSEHCQSTSTHPISDEYASCLSAIARSYAEWLSHVNSCGTHINSPFNPGFLRNSDSSTDYPWLPSHLDDKDLRLL